MRGARGKSANKTALKNLSSALLSRTMRTRTDQNAMTTPQTIEMKNFEQDAAAFILTKAREALKERGLFRLSLSGGKTPRGVYMALAAGAGDLPWDKVQITFGDERCVPPDHADSNYKMANEALFVPTGIPSGNVFRIEGEIDPDTAARQYEAKLAAVAARFGEPIYAHDLVLLGIGEDGHTASLFPGSPALEETKRLLLPVIGPKPPPQRISMTFPLINAARCRAFLVTGKEKEAVIRAVQAGDPQYPASRAQNAVWLWG